MLEKALGDINMPSELEGETESPSNRSLVMPQVEHAGQNLADLQKGKTCSFVKSPANGDGGANNGGELGDSDVEYIESENLNDVDVDLILKGMQDPATVKSLKNPRNAVCRTALRTSSDIFKVYGDEIVDLMDPLGVG